VSAQRVLFVHHRPQPSGAARSLALLIAALGDEWEAHVLVPGGGAAELFEQAGATVHRAPVPAFTHTWDVQYRGLRWLVAVRELLWLPAHRRALRRLLRELHPALVHLNDSVLLASGAVAHGAGVPVVWHLRSSLASGGRDARSRWIARRIDSWGDAAIAIDGDVAASFPLRVPMHVIPNPVVIDEAQPLDLHIPAGRVRIGYVGYLRRQKGWPQFLDALRMLVDEGVPVHGVVVGGAIRPSSAFRGWRGRVLEAIGVPDEERAFDRRIAELDLGDHVTSVPFTLSLGPVYRALDVVVFPNQGAGLGRPVLEAAAYGLPAVASGSPDGGGVLEPDRSGLLLRDGTAAELATALRLLCSDPALRSRLGSTAQARILTLREVAHRVETVYAGAIGGPR
jgi:glycosyltransferase involved in cell wall biosynthesis